MRFAMAAFAAVVSAACGDDAASGGAGPGGGDQGGAGGAGGEELPPGPEIPWTACPVETAADLECADVPVPLDWDDPAGDSIRVHVQRLGATSTPRASLWLLEGGPGAPGAWMVDFAARMHAEHPDLDIFVPDHRGAGGTVPLQCDPTTDPPTEACLAELAASDGTRIPYVTTTQSARDVSAIAQWTSRSGVNLLYGRSYGTYWAHRAVTVSPAAWDALVLDSPCHPSGCGAAHRDAEVDAVGAAFLAMCDAEPICAAKVGRGAEGFARDVVASADAGACAGAVDGGLTGERLRTALSMLLTDEAGRSLIPAVLVRYARCSPTDLDALLHLASWSATFDGILAFVPDFSLPTNYHVTRSEFWDDGFTADEARAQLTTTAIASGASVRWAETFEDWPWPIPEVDPAYESWTELEIPSLVLVGGLDASTPAHLVEDGPAGLGTRSRWVGLGYAGHVASADPGSGYMPCALRILDQFLAAPGADIDTACVEEADASIRAHLFDVEPYRSVDALGTSDAYGDDE